MPARSTLALRDDLEPWERQPQESAEAFEAWVRYRDMKPRRSTYKVAVGLAKAGALVRRWSARWGWIDRARLYDNYLDAEVRRENEKSILDFRRRAAQMARGKAQTLMMVDMGLSERLQKLAAGGQNLAAALEGIDTADLLLLATRGAQALPQLLRAEALALGDSTDRADVALTATPEDTLTRRIRENDGLRSLAAALVEQAGKPPDSPA